MTCIAGLVDDNKIWMGADSQGTSGWNRRIRSDPKICLNGSCIMGFTGSYRMSQLLMYAFSPPRQGKDKSDYDYLVTTFIDAVRKCLKKRGRAWQKDGIEEGGTFLVGYRGNLYRIENDYQVGCNIKPYDACGCGQDFALGSLFSTERRKMTPKARITEALKAATQFSAGVSAPYNTLVLERG